VRVVAGSRQSAAARKSMAKGKWQMANVLLAHLQFAACHFPFEILFSAYC
jgi:hypothetical protein